jgi:hypothetical protein
MKFTHEGILEGCDNRTKLGTKFKVKLRETKNFWVTESGAKYRKESGWGVGQWPMYHLLVATITVVPSEVEG